MSSKIEQLKRLQQKVWVKMERARFEYGTLGRINSDGTVTVEADRQDFVFVTMDTGTLTTAYNAGNGAVDNRAGLPVRVRDDNGRKIIDGINTDGLLEGDRNAPGKVYSVNGVGPDAHGNVANNFDDLGDVSATSPVSGGVVQYNDFDNRYHVVALADLGMTLDDLFGVGTLTPAAKDVLAYIGGQWIDASFAAIADDEYIEDLIATVLSGTSPIEVNYNDGAGVITVDLNASAADKMLYSTAADTWAETAITAFGRSLIDDAAASNARSTLGLVIGTDVQAYDAELAAIAGLTSAADSAPYFTGSGTAALMTVTSFARTFLDDANAAAVLATLGISVYDTETAQDVVGALIIDSSSIDATYNDGAGTLTLAIIDEYVQDVAGAMLTDGNGIDLSYNDTLGQISAALTTLTSDWDIGASRKILAEALAARNSSGLTLYDDGGNAALRVNDGGAISALIKLLVSGGSQDYAFVGDGNNFTVQAQGSGNVSVWGLYAADGDGTDIVQLEFYAVGRPGAITDRERVIVGWDPTNGWFRLISNAAGTGTVRPIHLLTGTNTQLYLDTNGKVYVGLTTGVGASGVLAIKAGSSSNDAAVGGVLYVDSGTHNNSGSSATDLASYSVPANTLSSNNMSVTFEAWGTFTSSINSKSLRVLFGSDSWTIIAGIAGSSASWYIQGRIVRTGAATQDVIITLICGAGGTPVTISTATRTLSSLNTLKLSGTGGASNEIAQEGFVVKWADSNT